jgi:hypothetical protein
MSSGLIVQKGIAVLEAPVTLSISMIPQRHSIGAHGLKNQKVVVLINLHLQSPMLLENTVIERNLSLIGKD